MTTQKKKLSSSERTRALAEGALMLALGTVLQFIPIVKMPFGGDVTAFCMLPIILIAYRYGVKFGLMCGFAYSLIQMLLGMSNLQYGTTIWAIAAIVLFDYVIAYTATALGATFRSSRFSQPVSIALGTVLVCAVRLACHFISGCTVWAVWAPEGMPVWQYSILYNSAYMIPETVITVAAGVWLAGFIDFKSPTLGVKAREENKNAKSTVLKTLSALFVFTAIVIDTLHIFSVIQSEEGFDLSLIVNSDLWLLVGVTGIGAVLAALLYFLGKRSEK